MLASSISRSRRDSRQIAETVIFIYVLSYPKKWRITKPYRSFAEIKKRMTSTLAWGFPTSPPGCIGWRAGTTNLCRSQLYPPVRDCEFGHRSASYELRIAVNGKLLLSSVINMVEPSKIAHISAKCAGKFEFSNKRYSRPAISLFDTKWQTVRRCSFRALSVV